jgi:GT2 family glycosyltransferase
MSRKVSIVTINYNQSVATCDMLESLVVCNYPNLEIFVVDNASPTDQSEIIKQKFPSVIFIQSKVNLGFAGGNNLALRQATGDYIYLINNDTIIPQGNIECLVKTLDSDPFIGMVCPKIMFQTSPKTIQFAGYTDMSKYTFRNRCIGYGEPDNGQHDRIRDTAFAHGAAMMLKREVFDRIGLMNEEYFLYYEETDWSIRIRNAGYRIVYTPDTYILHKESLSTGKDSPLQTYYLNRNRTLFIRRNMTGSRKFIGVLYQMCVVFPKNLFIFVMKGQFDHTWAMIRAWGWNLRKLIIK